LLKTANFVVEQEGAAIQSPPLWGRCPEGAEVGKVLHTPVSPKIRNNARKMRKALTDAELKLWNELRAHRLMGLGFRRQMPIAGYIVDFACPSHRLIVELDGSQHGTDDAVAYDQQRTMGLQDDGWTVLRFWNDDILKDIDNICLHIIRTTGGQIK
jgi:very-short-patch-repair endonuclease